MVPVFYRPEMSTPTKSYSPSSDKPRIVVEHWLSRGLIKPEQVHSFDPADRADFYLAHDADFVGGILDATIPNGFGNHSPQVAAALPYTTGSMIASAQHVLHYGGIACSPSSGFHHAGHNYAEGFCTLNGLAIAAIKAAKAGAKVGILDCDAHYGDGTADILQRNPGYQIQHHSFGQYFPCGSRANGWLEWFYSAIDALKACDIVLYQAGADPFKDDPLGGQLSLTELYLRDQAVFDELRNVAWNFAGGYATSQDGSLGTVATIHTTTMTIATKAAKGKGPV